MISSDTLPTGLLSEETVTCAANSPRLIFQPNYIDLLQTSKRTMQKLPGTRPAVRFPWWSTARTKHSAVQNWNQKESSNPHASISPVRIWWADHGGCPLSAGCSANRAAGGVSGWHIQYLQFVKSYGGVYGTPDRTPGAHCASVRRYIRTEEACFQR